MDVWVHFVVTLPDVMLQHANVPSNGSSAYRDALLMNPDAEGDAWVIGAERQFNAAIVISRGTSCVGRSPGMAAAAQFVGGQALFRFDAGTRATKGLLCL